MEGGFHTLRDLSTKTSIPMSKKTINWVANLKALSIIKTDMLHDDFKKQSSKFRMSLEAGSMLLEDALK